MDDICHSRNSGSGGLINFLARDQSEEIERAIGTDIIDIGVDRFSIKAFLALLILFFYVFADPNISIQTEDEINTAWQYQKVCLQTLDQDGGHCNNLSITKLGNVWLD